MPRSAIVPKLWALGVACALASSAARAQVPAQTPASPEATATASAPSEPTPEAKEAARSAYSRGQEAFAAGRYEDARKAFEEAFAAVPNPIVLLSVSESQAKLGHVKDAIASLQRYLELRPTAADRADVEGKIKQLGSTPAFVSVTSKPPGAQLTIDDSAAQQIAPAQLELAPGKHVLKYALPGHVGSSEVLEVEPGARYELEVVLQPAPPEAPPPPPVAVAPPPPAAPTGPPTTALWITASVGAAGIIAGSVLGILALKAESDFDAMPTEELADKGERLALFADVGFGIGIMALTTTAVLLFTQDSAPTEEAPAQAAKLELIPQVSPTAASATARVRF